jgi:hypothetical protein
MLIAASWRHFFPELAEVDHLEQLRPVEPATAVA